jgi:hypothetical protein
MAQTGTRHLESSSATVTSGRTGPKLLDASSNLRLLRRAQNDAVRNDALSRGELVLRNEDGALLRECRVEGNQDPAAMAANSHGNQQGKSGLGLDAQRAAVANYLNGGNWKLVSEFTEIESGKNGDRPQLAAALAACKKRKARLVIAKLDRLSRNLAFIANLIESGTRIRGTNLPRPDMIS